MGRPPSAKYVLAVVFFRSAMAARRGWEACGRLAWGARGRHVWGRVASAAFERRRRRGRRAGDGVQKVRVAGSYRKLFV